jgi:hypothetical protein
MFFLELVQAVKDFLLGLVANAAGVVEHQIGLFELLHLRVAIGNQRADDFFGVVRVHLAAEGFDVKSFHEAATILL